MALNRTPIKEAVDTAMAKIAVMDKAHYSQLMKDRDGMVGFKKEVEKTAGELFFTVNSIRAKDGKIGAIHEALPHLPHDRVELIRTSLRSQTFVMSVVKHGDSQKVHITKNDKKYMPSLDLPSSDASGLQIASVVVESVALVLNLVGISIPENPQGLEKAIKIAQKAFTTGSSIVNRIEQMKTAHDNDDTRGMAMAILGLVLDLFHMGIFIDIAQALLSEMHWYDWLLTAAKLTAFITLLISTGGLAEVAELVSLLLDAVDFIRKLDNLKVFDKA